MGGLNQSTFDKIENWETLLSLSFQHGGRQGKCHRKLDTHHFLLAGKQMHSLPRETHLSVVAPSIDNNTFSGLGGD